jgi:hypothetical protein
VSASTASTCPSSTLTHCSVRMSHTRMVLSHEPLYRCLESAVNTRTLSAWPSNTATQLNEFASHTLTVASSEPEKT